MKVNMEYNKLSIKRDIKPVTEKLALGLDVSLVEAKAAEALGSNAVAVIWMIHKVQWVRFTDGHLVLERESAKTEYWQELRIFNGQGELQLVREQEKLIGRLILDKDSTESWQHGYVDSISPLWGDAVKSENGMVHLEDRTRKINMVIPCGVEAKRYGLVTRSYIHVDEKTGLSGYGDYRYLAIEGMEV